MSRPLVQRSVYRDSKDKYLCSKVRLCDHLHLYLPRLQETYLHTCSHPPRSSARCMPVRLHPMGHMTKSKIWVESPELDFQLFKVVAANREPNGLYHGPSSPNSLQMERYLGNRVSE
jgi:hypothetical protein